MSGPEVVALRYIELDAAGGPAAARNPFGGLKLSAFRTARRRLVERGYVKRNAFGRYIPVAFPGWW